MHTDAFTCNIHFIHIKQDEEMLYLLLGGRRRNCSGHFAPCSGFVAIRDYGSIIEFIPTVRCSWLDVVLFNGEWCSVPLVFIILDDQVAWRRLVLPVRRSRVKRSDSSDCGVARRIRPPEQVDG